LFRIERVLCILAVLLPASLHAQSQRQAAVDSASLPSLSETRDWLRRALPELGRAVSPYTTRDGVVLRTVHETVSADIVECRLLLNVSFSLNDRPKVEGSHSVPLAMVDLSRLAAYRGSDPKENATDAYVLIQAPIGQRPYEYRTPGSELRFGSMVQVWATNAESAQRILAAVRRAAELCGARADPF
jgi:hypothetical protein